MFVSRTFQSKSLLINDEVINIYSNWLFVFGSIILFYFVHEYILLTFDVVILTLGGESKGSSDSGLPRRYSRVRSRRSSLRSVSVHESGPRHQLRHQARSGLPTVLQQAMECRPIRSHLRVWLRSYSHHIHRRFVIATRVQKVNILIIILQIYFVHTCMMKHLLIFILLYFYSTEIYTFYHDSMALSKSAIVELKTIRLVPWLVHYILSFYTM